MYLVQEKPSYRSEKSKTLLVLHLAIWPCSSYMKLNLTFFFTHKNSANTTASATVINARSRRGENFADHYTGHK